MPRIRSVKPEFWSDRRLATRVSRDARLLYVALWNFADEHGRLQGDSRYVKGNCLPYDDDLGLGDIDRLLAALERAGRIRRYDHDGDPYIFLPKLAEHQRLEAEKVPSRLPAPPQSPPPAPVDPDPSASTGAGQSAPRADSSERDVDENALLYVAGGRGQVAGGRGSAHDAPRADVPALVGEFIDRCRKRPPDKFIARIGNEIKSLTESGTEPADIRGGLVIVAERGLQPTALPGAVHEHLNARPRTQRTANTQILDAAMERARNAEASHERSAIR